MAQVVTWTAGPIMLRERWTVALCMLWSAVEGLEKNMALETQQNSQLLLALGGRMSVVGACLRLTGYDGPSAAERCADMVEPVDALFNSFCCVCLQLFNPPYVPTPDEELARDGIARAWAGGHMGRRVTDRLLSQVCPASALFPALCWHAFCVLCNLMTGMG